MSNNFPCTFDHRSLKVFPDTHLKIAPRIESAWHDMLPNSFSISSTFFAFENRFPDKTSSASDRLKFVCAKLYTCVNRTIIENIHST